jgi:hypothetical protein
MLDFIKDRNSRFNKKAIQRFKGKFDANAKFICLKSITLGGEQFKPGDEVPSNLGLYKLSRLMNANIIMPENIVYPEGVKNPDKKKKPKQKEEMLDTIADLSQDQSPTSGL